MSVKKLIELAPGLCGAPDARKHAIVADLVWRHEMDNNGFPRRRDETARERIAFLFHWPCMDEEKKLYIEKLVEMNVLAHYAEEHSDDESKAQAVALTQELSAQEALYPDVSAILPVSTAARGWWDA